jgi:hypothetical protein
MIDRRNFIPTVSPLIICRIDRDFRKGSALAHVVGHSVVIAFITPINLKKNDLVFTDGNSLYVEGVERDGIVIYRRAWRN